MAIELAILKHIFGEVMMPIFMIEVGIVGSKQILFLLFVDRYLEIIDYNGHFVEILAIKVIPALRIHAFHFLRGRIFLLFIYHTVNMLVTI